MDQIKKFSRKVFKSGSAQQACFPEGIKELHPCPNAVVDVCFIHGLTGDREKTWTANGNKKSWPELLLPTRLPNARILTWGYDAYLMRVSRASENCLTDHATNLLTDLTNDRSAKQASSRGLIFVAHSLGGLVCKEAILMSRNNPESHLKCIFQHTKAIAFMGTPHKGSWIADWTKIPIDTLGVVKSINTKLHSVLRTQDSYLSSLHDRFCNLLRDLPVNDHRRLHVTCFYEELGMTGYGKIVSKESATFDGYSLLSIRADHKDMVRFAEGNNGFERLAGELLRWTGELDEVSLGKHMVVRDSPQERILASSDGNFFPSEKLCSGFEDRDGVMEELRKKIHSIQNDNEMPVGLLHGVPGIGKTQVCLKFAKTLKESYPWIWLVNAESQRSLNHDYADIASDLGLRSINDFEDQASAQDHEKASQPERTVGEIVRKKLSRTKVHWVLIFDNLKSTTTMEFSDYLPNSTNGIVLICAPHSTAEFNTDANFAYHVPKLGIGYLEKIFWSSMDKQKSEGASSKELSLSVQVLIRTLECHTLSVRLAARYVATDSGRRPTLKDVGAYIAAFQHKGGDLPPQLRDILKPLWQSFKLIIDRLKEIDEEKFKDAIALLRLNTLFSYNYLPRRLFDEVIRDTSCGLDFLSSSLRFLKAAEVLAASGLLVEERVEQEHGTSMLQVLHRCARVGMWTEESAERTKKGQWRLAIRVLGGSIPSGSRQQEIDFRRIIVPHIDACLGNYADPCSLLLDGNLDLGLAIKILLDFSWVYLESGRFGDSKALQDRASTKAEAAFGPMDELTLRANRELALSLYILGESERSLQLRERVYEESKRKCSLEESEVSLEHTHGYARRFYNAAADLAVSYSRHVAHRKEALQLRRKVLTFAEAALTSSNHSDADKRQLLKAKRDYAMSLFEFDERKEALRLREEVCASLNDEGHGYAWNARRDLVVSLIQTGQVVRATNLAEEILADRRQRLGDDHPDTCVALATRAAVFLRSEENEEALTILREVVDKFTIIWGHDHLMTLHARIDLGKVLLKLQETHESALDEATEIQREVFETMNRNLEPRNYEVLMAQVQMARIIQYRNPAVARMKMEYVIGVLQEHGDPYCDVVKLGCVDCLIDSNEQHEAAETLETMENGQNDVPTALELRRMLKLAAVYISIAEDRNPASNDPLGSLKARTQDPVDDTSSVSWRCASATSSQNINTETSSTETLDVPLDNSIVYRSFTRQDLIRMSCDLRKRVVEVLESANTELECGDHEDHTDIINDHFTARAYYSLAQSYVRDSLFPKATVLQNRVLLYYQLHWGSEHGKTKYHQRRLDEWSEHSMKVDVISVAGQIEEVEETTGF